MKKIFLLIVLLLPFFSKAWDLPGVEIIERSKRGADESLRFYEQYKEILEERKSDQKDLEELKEEDYEKYKEIIKDQKRDKYMEENYSERLQPDKVKDTYKENRLFRPEEYHLDKESIILHHTARDYNDFDDQNEVKEYINYVYHSHSVGREFGDIGYNFIIDHYGNIYEGRSGGEGVVGAHAKRNNEKSVGISLIGNFDIQKPTRDQLKSTIELLASLTNKYNINPLEKELFHREVSESPYINSFYDYSIIGHKDVAATSCPGNYLYSYLDDIRNVVSKLKEKEKYQDTTEITSISVQDELSQDDEQKNETEMISDMKQETQNPTKETKDKESKNFTKTKYIEGTSEILEFETEDNFVISCDTESNSFDVQSCFIETGKLFVEIENISENLRDKNYTIDIETDMSLIEYEVSLIRENQEDARFQENSNPNNGIEKIQHKVDLETTKNYLDKKVKVLLYELTRNYEKYKIECTNTCNLGIDDLNFHNVESFEVQKNSLTMDIWIEGEKYTSSFLDIINNDGLVVFKNYDRSSYDDIPWNSFRGNVFIKKDKIDPLDEEQQTDRVVINSLEFYDYMKGIVETNDQEHLEKNKIISLIAKNYMLFYFDKNNVHPSIPKEASYNAVDDPRIFQKYIGAGAEETIEKRYQALEETWGEIVLYDDYVPILPYFNCSTGQTLSGEDGFGWVDTPYLQSKDDFVSCDDYRGHGVGLSGQGAEQMAAEGYDYREILKYYYEGVEIKN